jgi:predicted neuraminidase
MTEQGKGMLPAVGDGRLDARIPSPCPQNHAANLAVLANGDLACAWFGGTQEGLPDTSIYMSRLSTTAGGWLDPVRLSADPDRSEQNPVLFPAPDGRLWLFYTAQHLGHQDTAVVRYRCTDDGRTWTDGQTLLWPSAEGGIFIRQPVTVLPDGSWLLPTFRCRPDTDGRWNGNADHSAVMISRDDGASWREHPVPDSTGLVHMNVIDLADGRLLALFRSRWADSIYTSRSADLGRTWSSPRPARLPNNNSSLQATRLRDGRLVLAFNNSKATADTARRRSLYDEISVEQPAATAIPTGRQAIWGTPRAPLSLAVSENNGRHWRIAGDLETGDGYCLTNNSRDGSNRELSYPAVAETPDGDLHIAFTYHRQFIKHIRLRDQTG